MSSDQVIFPPLRGSISNDLPKPLIALLGSLHGIAVGYSWHQSMIDALQRNGYTGKIYIPTRVDADIGDYSEELNMQEYKNNLFAVERSTKIIYWNCSSSDADLLWYTLALREMRKSRHFAHKHVFFGGNDHTMLARSLATLSDDMPVYKTMNDLCTALVESL